MIFHCPRCQAGHSVPASMVPVGGMELSCRRCGQPFGVSLGAEADPGPPSRLGAAEIAPEVAAQEATVSGPGPEATTVGFENPFAEPDSVPVLAPGGEAVSLPGFEITRSAIMQERLDSRLDLRSTAELASAPVPLGPDEVGMDPELDNTQRAQDEPEPQSLTPISVQAPARRVVSSSILPDLRPSWGARWSRAPLAFKVAGGVFVTVFVAVWGLGAGSKSEAPVQIAAAPVVAADAGVARAVAPPPPPEPPPEGPQGIAGDDPAPKGFAFLQAEARLTPRAEEGPGIKLADGQQVRLLHSHQGWSVVLVEPEGPTGFVATSLLAPQKALATLARELALACGTGQLDDCLVAARDAGDTCRASCGQGADFRVKRCLDACELAFEACAKQCQEPKKKRRRR